MAYVLMQWILSPDVPDAKCLQGRKKCLDKFKEEKPLSGNKIQNHHLLLRLIFLLTGKFYMFIPLFYFTFANFPGIFWFTIGQTPHGHSDTFF